MSFTPPVGAATASTRGLVRLSGDLSGTADSPTVPSLALKLSASEKGAVSGVATLDSNGKVPLTQLELTFPVTTVAGQTGDVALTKADVGLSDVDNTSDLDKPLSTTMSVALGGKLDKVSTTAVAPRAYVVDSTGAQTLLNIYQAAAGASIARRQSTGALTVADGAVASDAATKGQLDTELATKASTIHTHTTSQISDATTLGREVLTAADSAAAQSALAIANTVQVVDDFSDVTTPVYGTLYVVRA